MADVVEKEDVNEAMRLMEMSKFSLYEDLREKRLAAFPHHSVNKVYSVHVSQPLSIHLAMLSFSSCLLLCMLSFLP